MHRKKLIAFYVVLLAAAAAAEWAPISSSPGYIVYDLINADGVLYLAHFNGGVYRSTDSSASWQQINDGLNIYEARSTYQLLSSGDNLYVATVDGIYKSTDGGDHWNRKSNGIQLGPGGWYLFTESIFENEGTLYTGAWSGIYRSTDGGENWQATNITGSAISARYFVNHNGILFAAKETVGAYGYLSTDSGENWESLTSVPLPTITFFSEPPNLWAGTIGGAWLSTDDGASWTDRSEGLSGDPYNSSFIRVNGALITSVKFGGSGVFRSTNEGVLWEDFGEGLPFLNSIEKLIVYGGKIIAATSDGLWQRDTTEIIVGIESAKDILPSVYKLSQNYPNPFNAATEINYSIPVSGRVTLNIYDALGRQVETLVDEIKPAGNHSARFKASDLSSGVYFYKIQAGDYSQTKRMIFLK